MGYIKEPENVDFIINSEPLTEQERLMLSELIADYKNSDASLDQISYIAGASMGIYNAAFSVSQNVALC